MAQEIPEHAGRHPLVSLVGDLESLLAGGVDAAAWTMSPSDLTEVLPRLAKVENQIVAVRLRMLREADRHQVGDPVGAANTAGWWANTTRTTKPAAHKQIALASRLDDDSHDATAAALSQGAVNVDQAAVILDAVEALPADLVSPALRADAEEHLVGLAAHHDAKDLRILGRKVLDVLAPEIAEEHEQRVLENEERHAAATAMLTMRSDGHGSLIGRFKIPELTGAMLAKHVNALAAPRHRAAVDGSVGERVARPLSLGQAFIEYIETRRDAPQAGGVAATVVVTMTMEAILGAATAASLDTGGFISASESRRLLCQAGVYPAVLSTRSEVLDLGRKTRFHTEAQRIALGLKHGGCAEKHCDWPPGMCHAHHSIPWSHGGHTNVKDAMLLCPRHHTLAHDRRYQMKADSSGRVTFSRRT